MYSSLNTANWPVFNTYQVSDRQKPTFSSILFLESQKQRNCKNNISMQCNQIKHQWGKYQNFKFLRTKDFRRTIFPYLFSKLHNQQGMSYKFVTSRKCLTYVRIVSLITYYSLFRKLILTIGVCPIFFCSLKGSS